MKKKGEDAFEGVLLDTNRSKMNFVKKNYFIDKIEDLFYSK